MSLVLPTIVAVFGIIAVFGNNGWLATGLRKSGIELEYSIYGLSGILLAHVFFNLPLSARILMQALDRIPPESWRLASQLGISSFNSFRLIQWPVIKPALPGLILLVFSLCFTSFAIIMTLGGGPKATTIEVAIYQALRFDFELDVAIGLAVLQTTLCGILIFLNARFGKSADIFVSHGTPFKRLDGKPLPAKALDFAIIISVTLLVCLPLLAIVVAGFSPVLLTVLADTAFWKAALSTLAVSLLAGSLAVLLAAGLLHSSVHLRVRAGRHFTGRLLELSGSMILIIPPFVLGTGLFLLLRNSVDVFSLALPLTIVINALMGLPFAIRILEQPMISHAMHYDRLCAALGVNGTNRLTIIGWPLIRQPLGLALAICCTLAAGDLTAIALFGSQDVRTLPLLLYQRMGSYQLQEASVTAFLLLIYCLLLFRSIERCIGGKKSLGEDHVNA